VQVRNHDGAGGRDRDEPFLQSSLPAAGFGVIEAATLEEAVALAAQTPCAVAQGVVEVYRWSSAPRPRTLGRLRRGA
jgi:hypothetical protein